MKEGAATDDRATQNSRCRAIVHAFALLREDLDARQRRQVYAVCASLTAASGMTIGGSSADLSSYVPPGELLHHACVPHL